MSGGMTLLPLPAYVPEDEELQPKKEDSAYSLALRKKSMMPDADNSKHIAPLHNEKEKMSFRNEPKKIPLEDLSKHNRDEEDEEEKKVIPPTPVTGGH